MDTKKAIESAYINMRKAKSKRIPIIYDGKTEGIIEKQLPIAYDGKTEGNVNLKPSKSPISESLDHVENDLAHQAHYTKSNYDDLIGLLSLYYNRITPKSWHSKDERINNFGSFHNYATEIFHKKLKEEKNLEEGDRNFSDEQINEIENAHHKIKSVIDNHLKTNFYHSPELAKKSQT